jgi:hypothetical protein
VRQGFSQRPEDKTSYIAIHKSQIAMRHRALALYTRDSYILHFRKNMAAEFPETPAETVQALEVEFRDWSHRAHHAFKDALYQGGDFELARRQLRANDPGVPEELWLRFEAMILGHLLRVSYRDAAPPELWKRMQELAEPPQAAPPKPSEIAETEVEAAFTQPTHLNAALRFSLEWGENFGKPIFERMKKEFAYLTPSQIAALDKAAARIRSVAWQAYEDAYAKRITEGEAAKRIVEVFPGINGENLSHLYTQGMYYAWHG